MRKVYKYDIPMEDEFELELPEGADPVRVARQGDVARLWCLVDPDAPSEIRRFRHAGTGHEIDYDPEELEHIGTYFLYRRSLVFHVFEILDQDSEDPDTVECPECGSSKVEVDEERSTDFGITKVCSDCDFTWVLGRP